MVIMTADELQRRFDEQQTKFSEILARALAAPREVKYLSVAEVAKKLNVAALTIYRGVKAGKIPHKMVGNLIKIPATYLEK